MNVLFASVVVVIKDGFSLSKGARFVFEKSAFGSKISFVKFSDLTKAHIRFADLIISFGGDGTFLKAANLVGDTPILGINADPNVSEGALLSLTIHNLDALSTIFSGKYTTVFRDRAKLTLNGKLVDRLAINVVFIGNREQSYCSRYKITFNGVTEEQRSSGIIVSTGTGSTAWFHSAGGSPFPFDAKKLSFIVREPYVGERLFKPTILRGDLPFGEALIIESTQNGDGVLIINDLHFDFNSGDKAVIEVSEDPLRVIVPT